LLKAGRKTLVEYASLKAFIGNLPQFRCRIELGGR
jgi:hypothetical protein